MSISRHDITFHGDTTIFPQSLVQPPGKLVIIVGNNNVDKEYNNFQPRKWRTDGRKIMEEEIADRLTKMMIHTQTHRRTRLILLV